MPKIDDTEIKKRIKDAQKKKKNLDDVKLAVLEGHLLIEQALDEFIEASVFHPEQLNPVNTNFPHERASRAFPEPESGKGRNVAGLGDKPAKE